MRVIKQVKFICAAVTGLLMAGAAAAQTPVPAPEPVDPSDPAGMKLPAPSKPIAEDQENLLNLDLSTGGRVTIQLRPDVAPLHIARIKTLVREGFYNGVTFHRVIDGFMAQTGDPKGTGEGGSNLPDLTQEFNLLPHLRGAVSMARTNDPNSANSQFFIMFMPRPSLDRKYTVFGRVVSGMQFVDAIERGEPPATPSKVVKAWLQTDGENAALLPAAPPPPVAVPVVEATPVPAPETATPQ
ncbi:peptidylprolyl isomerase [Sphingobium boeckii]|uniref:Peptidyl-prolyl cis-trans isomerase n=1 Tax=Sphingobium boeckii TaxID=1082345 RepID=A0A7W9AHV1_9SPHN|nr:peptidylprolyl isomerase [Sphingobium boeckii]MBB5685781.1 peptidylprolyl isomerase [Sphingobium boeckii]